MLKEAKEQCDELWVGLQVDPSLDRPEKNSPIQSITERAIQLSAVKYVDRIFIYETEKDLVELIEKLHPDVRILGSDYVGKDFTGKDLCERMGIEIYYNSRDHAWSTTELRERIIGSLK
jgi:glycerol-3-phosphate cytidylyltransferase